MNSTIRKCRYKDCKHSTREIDITKDEFKVKGSMYYHTDCYKLNKESAWKDEKTKADLQYIKTQWILHISNTVVYSELFRCLNGLLDRGITSDYLVFVMDYVVKNKLTLNHPNGFKYYVDKQYIKDAYNKHLLSQSSVNVQTDFVVSTDDTNTPKFSINKKPSGFGSILKKVNK